MKYHYKPMRIEKKKWYTNCWKGCRETGCLIHWWWEYKMVQPPWKTVWQFLNKTKHHLPYNLVIILLGILSQRNGTLCSHKNLYTSVHSSFIHQNTKLKTAQISSKQWMTEHIVGHAVQYCATMKRNKLWIHATRDSGAMGPCAEGSRNLASPRNGCLS